MFSLFPNKKSNKWLIIFVSTLIAITTLFSLYITLLLGENLNQNILSILVIAIISSAIVSLSGYFHLKYIFSLSLLGVIVGISIMTYFFTRGNDFDGLLGGLMYVYSLGISTIIGITIQIVIYFINRKK